MNASDRLLFRENHFSWSRMMALVRLCWPSLRGILLVLSLAVLVLTVAMGAYVHFTQKNPSMLAYYVLSMLTVLSPLAITRRDFRSVTAQLPVTASEKTTALLLLFWVVFPLSTFVFQYVGEWIIESWFGVDLVRIYMNDFYDDLALAMIFGTVQTLCIIVIELYALVTARKNRIIAAIGAAVGTVVGFMLMSVVMFFCIGIWIGLRARAAGATDLTDEMYNLPQVLAWVITILLAVSVAATIIFTFKLNKRLNNSGF